jgi:hypothetical protein
MKYALSEVRKAMLAFAAPFATVLVSAVTSASDGGSTITKAEWVTAACGAVITGSGVFAVRNKPGKGQRRKADVSEAAPDYPGNVPAHFDRPDDRPGDYSG